ncbi:MAG TPA: IS1182 family transposase [Polyangia bacterium]
MTLGRAPTHEDLYGSSRKLCEERLPKTSIYALLAREGHRLFPDDSFADLFQKVGRPSIAPRVVAVVMVLQRFEGLSDREAVDRFTFDMRWKYAAGGLDFDHPGFVHTVLVDMRERLRRSARPNRIFEAVLEVAKEAGLVGRRRVLDSTALYDAVATQDTVTLIRSAIRGVLRVAPAPLEAELRGTLRRDDDYAAAGKPACEWDDAAAREALVDALARDGFALLAVLDERKLEPDLEQAATLLATVLGQDLEQRDDGVFRIARRVAPDRVVSTVDPETRHGHKTSARGFDGYKGHVAIDPDSEIITATTVTAGNAGDASAAEALLGDVLDAPRPEAPQPSDGASSEARAEVYGDASYGTAELVEKLEAAGVEANVKVQPPSAREGHFAQDAFRVDTKSGTVTCPAGVLVVLRPRGDGTSHADFGPSCATCPLRAQCTDSKSGRQINVHPKHDTLARARARQRDPEWKRRYRAIRPRIERRLSHLMRRKHGGRRARVRGVVRVGHDFALLGAAHNLARLAVLMPAGAARQV